MVNYPTSLDTDTTLYDVTDNIDFVLAIHHNALKDAVIAIETALGITAAFNFTTDAEFSSHTGSGHVDWTQSGAGTIHTDNYIEYSNTLVEAVITAELVDGQSIDNAIDTLIGNHQGVSTAHHSPTVAGDLNHNDLANLNAGDAYEHITQTQKTALHAKYALTEDLSSQEITQLQTIGESTTIIAGQWGYLGALTESPQTHMGAVNPHSSSASDTDLSTHASDTSTHGVAQVANHAEIATQISTHTGDDNAHHEVFEPGDEDGAIATHAALTTGVHGVGASTVAAVSDLHSEGHVLAVTGPHTGTLPLADLAVGSTGSVIIRGAADWEELVKSTNDKILTLVGGYPAWADPSGGSHTLDSATHTDIPAMTEAEGDIIYRNASSQWVRLAKGIDNYTLMMAGNVPNWEDHSSASAHHAKWTTGDTEGVITAELVDGQSIDLAIDALILTHKNIAGAHHAKYALTEDLTAGEITQLQAIDEEVITSAKWKYLADMTEDPQTHMSAANPHSSSASDTDLSTHAGIAEHPGLDALDDRDFKPNTSDTYGTVRPYFTSLGGMTGAGDSDYQDLIIFNSYVDGTGGDINALTFDKSEKLIKHWLADQGDATWGTPETLAYLSDVSTHASATATHGVSEVADAADLHAQSHDNTYHTTNYEAANANIQSHVGTPPTDSHHTEAHVLTTIEGVHTGSLPLSDLTGGSTGSIVIAGAEDWEELVKGSNSDVLTLVSGYPAWVAQGAPGVHDIITGHNDTGLTIGNVIRATGATTFAWAQLAHGDLSGIGSNAHSVIDTHLGAANPHSGSGTGDGDTLWSSNNPTSPTRYWSIDGSGIAALATYVGGHNTWVFDVANGWADTSTIQDTYVQIHLPHGATVTALRVRAQETGSVGMTIYLNKITQSTGASIGGMGAVNVTSTMTELSDTTIIANPIDNNLYSYRLKIDVWGTGEARIRAIQIDYTVVRPQP